MNTINKDKLKERLLQDSYVEANGLNMTIERLSNLKGNALEMLTDWMDNGVRPEFEAIEGIDSTMLREKLQMKEPAIILSYGMLLADPQNAAIRLKSLLSRRIYYHPKK